MALDLNTEPYNDDFDADKNFYQILFKPSLAVQARELTQLQSILRDQIAKFGNHVFQHGSVVIPGNSLSDLAVPYVKVQTQFNGTDININNFLDKVIVGGTSGVKAIVKKVIAATETDPITFYITYVSGALNGDGTNGAVKFADNEEIYVESASTIRAQLNLTNATGVGSLAYINRGVYYVNGTFVGVDSQSHVISKYTSTPSCHVLLQIVEEIVDAIADESLLDNAQSSYNYAAPGADRLKITLALTSLPLGTTISNDYVEIMRFNNGVLEEHAKTPKYSELAKALAERTFDESGNYVVDGFTSEVRENLKSGKNNGVYEASAGGDANKLVYEVSPGKAYVQGFPIEKISSTRFTVDKARTAAHATQVDVVLRPEYGQYLILSDLTGSFSIYNKDTIDLFSVSADGYSNFAATSVKNIDDLIFNPSNGILYKVTARTAPYQTGASAPVHTSGSDTNGNLTLTVVPGKLGTAKVIGIDYLTGDPADALYKVWVTDVALNEGYTLENVGGIRYNNNTDAANKLIKFTVPITAGAFVDGEVVTHTSGRKARVKYWTVNDAALYAYKHDYYNEAPKVGDSIVGESPNTTNGVVTERFAVINVGQPSLLFKLPKELPFSLRNTEGDYTFQYVVEKELTIVAGSGGGGSTSISGGVINPIEVGTFIAVGPLGVLDNDNFSLDVSGTEVTMDAGTVAGGSTVKIFAAVTKIAGGSVSPKTKTLVTATPEVIYEWTPTTIRNIGDKVYSGSHLYVVTDRTGDFKTDLTAPTHTSGAVANGNVTLSHVSTMSKITLNKTDIDSVVSIVDGIGDITANYNLWNGQTDYAYLRGEVRLINGRRNPSGDITITYKHFQHSTTGDFFCVNSYSSVADFLDRATRYISQTNGVSYSLAGCLDFRPSVGEDGTFTGTGAVKHDALISGTQITTVMQYYTPRIDSLVINSVGTLSVISGSPAEVPRSPVIPEGQFELIRYYVPEYTASSATVKVKRLDVDRFTMSDIQKILTRVEKVEEFATLTAEENNLINYEVIDAETGLTRFKTGYLVETFDEPLTIANTTNADYDCTIVAASLTVPHEQLNCPMMLMETSTGFVQKNGYIMLPYTEVEFVSQKFSSRTTNLNPFLVFKWTGKLDVNPASDTWVEIVDRPDIIEEQTDTVYVSVPLPCYYYPYYNYYWRYYYGYYYGYYPYYYGYWWGNPYYYYYYYGYYWNYYSYYYPWYYPYYYHWYSPYYYDWYYGYYGYYYYYPWYYYGYDYSYRFLINAGYPLNNPLVIDLASIYQVTGINMISSSASVGTSTNLSSDTTATITQTEYGGTTRNSVTVSTKTTRTEGTETRTTVNL